MIHPAIVAWADLHAGTVLLETTRIDHANYRSYLFESPLQIVTCTRLSEVERSLDNLQQAVNEGNYVAGYLAYEAGYAFESRFDVPDEFSFPLLWFGIYDRPIVFNHQRGTLESGKARLSEITHNVDPSSDDSIGLSPTPSISQDEYCRAFERVRRYLIEGDTYQVNLTFKLRFPLDGAASRWYNALRKRQKVSYAGFLQTGEHSILSFSPELFFRMDGGSITLKPMKGTASRGRTLAEDELRVQALRQSEKERSENLMIVDLLRNDVGKMARPGSVRVERFFDVEKYETVLQATSTITAELPADISLKHLMHSLFPSGSVTGAPKIRTMQIIRELEKESRNVYTGSIGFVAPHREAIFNVAIRTLVVDRTGHAEMGVGSGLVIDSNVEAEYRESLLKGRFLTEQTASFELLETIRWDKSEGWFLLEFHRKRMSNSAEYFGFTFDNAKWERTLRLIAEEIGDSGVPMRVRITMNRVGDFSWKTQPLLALPEEVRVCFSGMRVNSSERFLFHKTTHRAMFDTELAVAKERGYFDVVFENERGEITEGARSNVVILTGGRYLTPPIDCGVLAGTYREHLFDKKTVEIEEKVIFRQDIVQAERVFVCNALYGMVEVVVDQHSGLLHVEPTTIEKGAE